MKIRPVRFALARLAVKRSGSASASARAKRWAKSLTSGHFAFGRQRHDDVHALAAGQHREGLQAHVGEVALEVARRLLHLVEVEAVVGIEIEHHAGRASRRRRPSMPQPWNSIVPICTQARMPATSVDVEIILRRARPSRGSGRGGHAGRSVPASCFWKKHFLARPCGQRTRLIGRFAVHAHHRRADRAVIIGELALGDLRRRGRSPGPGC